MNRQEIIDFFHYKLILSIIKSSRILDSNNKCKNKKTNRTWLFFINIKNKKLFDYLNYINLENIIKASRKNDEKYKI